MKRIIIIAMLMAMFTSSTTVSAATVPRESLPCNATEEQIIVTERLVGHIFDEVINGTGYADARAKSNRIIFNAWLNKQADGFAYGELVNIANRRRLSITEICGDYFLQSIFAQIGINAYIQFL